jgi:hypothetical protein
MDGREATHLISDSAVENQGILSSGTRVTLCVRVEPVQHSSVSKRL